MTEKLEPTVRVCMVKYLFIGSNTRKHCVDCVAKWLTEMYYFTLKITCKTYMLRIINEKI